MGRGSLLPLLLAAASVVVASARDARDDPAPLPDEAGLELEHYHNYTTVKNLFRRLEREFPRLARLHSIGRSVQKRQLYVLQVRRRAGHTHSGNHDCAQCSLGFLNVELHAQCRQHSPIQ